MRNARFALATLALAACDGSGTTTGGGEDAGFVANCTAGAPSAEAKMPAGHLDDHSAILPGGRLVAPWGRVLDIGGYPIALRVLAGGRYVVVTDDAVKDQALVLADLQAADANHPVVSSHAYPILGGNSHSPGLFYGLALAADGKRIWVSNGGYDPVADGKPLKEHYNTIEAYDLVGDPPALVANDAATLHLGFAQHDAQYLERLPSGIALSADEKLMYVATQFDGSLAILDLTAGPGYGAEIGTAKLPGLGPYDVAVDPGTKTAFVSLWGGMQTGKDQYIDGVVPVDVSNPMAPVAAAQPIPTGKAAEAELWLAGKIFVTNADSDTLSVIDAASQKVRTMPVTSSMILGATPNNLAIDPGTGGNAGRVYIVNANENSVVVLDLASFAILGHVPTGWYPTAVAVLPDGGLAITSARGLGFGPADGVHPSQRTAGILQVVPRPSDADLKRGTQEVADNEDRPRRIGAQLTCPAGAKVEDSRFSLAAAPGAPSPIKHVFLIVRENKTYDAVFGSLGIGNGDPALQAWPENVLPNAQALAKQFVLLDNFYSHAELSLQGHEWTTGCIANDYVEKGWGATDDYGRGYRPTEAFSATIYGRLAYPGSDSIWVHLDKAGVRYHNYGEITNLAGAKTVLDVAYPGIYFNTSILDVKKEAYVAQTILDQGEDAEPFSYILLPNDHTAATQDGAPHPFSMMADNDEATGRFVDDISHSPLWGSSLIIVVEDDPGGGGDHVEQHRSICLMASPWLKRGYISSSMYDLGSVYRSIGLALGVPPLNVYDAHAAPFYELFTTTPDLTPYTFIPRKIPIQSVGPDDPLVDESNKMDFSRPDRDDLSRVLWKVYKGKDAEPPWLKNAPVRPRPDSDD